MLVYFSSQWNSSFCFGCPGNWARGTNHRRPDPYSLILTSRMWVTRAARLAVRRRAVLPPTTRSRSQPTWPTWGRSTALTALQMLQTCGFAAPTVPISSCVRSASRREQRSVITGDGTATSRSTAVGSLSGVPRQREDGPAGKSSRYSMLSSSMDLETGYSTF